MNMFLLWMDISGLLIVVGFIVYIKGLCRFWGSSTMTFLGLLIIIVGVCALAYSLHITKLERHRQSEEAQAEITAQIQTEREETRQEYEMAVKAGYSVYINGAQVDPDDIDPDKYVDYMTFNDELKKIYITFI